MHLVVFIGYHQKKSFCHNGIVKTISETCKTYEKVKCTVVDLYDDEFHAAFHAEKNKELLVKYKDLITDAINTCLCQSCLVVSLHKYAGRIL